MRLTPKCAGTLVAAGAVLVATACSGPSGAQGGGGDGTLTIGVGEMPSTLDPGRAYGREEFSILGLAGGTLTTVHSDKVSMLLAESVTPNEDGYIVKLKPDLKFSNGSPLTADDVAASFKHFMADDANAYVYVFDLIERVTASDDLTVRFDLKHPYPSLPYLVALPATTIVPSEAIRSRGSKNLYKGDPLPTAGQFQISSFGENEITLRVNPQYVGPHPKTQTVVFKRITDNAARVAQVQSGQIDYADEISPKDAAQFGDSVEIRKYEKPMGMHLLQMNHRKNSVLSDVRIRQAIAIAVDRKQISRVAYADLSRPALHAFGVDPQYGEPFLLETADVARAKELLGGTRCANGCTLRFPVPSDDQPYQDTAVVVQQNLKAIGIDVRIQMGEPAVIGEQKSQGNFDLGIAGQLDFAPDAYISTLLGPIYNAYYTDYSNPEMDRLIARLSRTGGPQREAVAQQINALFEKDMPVVPLGSSILVSGSRVPAEEFDIDDTFYYLYRVG